VAVLVVETTVEMALRIQVVEAVEPTPLVQRE
jgi:hypothetical protein